MKSLAAISLLTTVALAQSSVSTGNSLIPDNISSGCQTFLNSFDGDTSLTACTESLIEATQSFGGSSGTPAKAQITGAISSICTGSVSTACPDSLIRGKLSDFYAACSDELTSSSPNQQVINLYDILYVLTPLEGAICSKDDSGNYCIISSDSSTGGALANTDYSTIQNNLAYTPQLSRRDDGPTMANLTTFHDSYLPFGFRTPDMDSTTLCTPCTRNILTPYFNFESDMPYAPGLANSPMLSNQNTLVSAIQSKCGANFLNGAVQAAGGIQTGPLLGAAMPHVSSKFSSLCAVVAGGLTVAISSLL